MKKLGIRYRWLLTRTELAKALLCSQDLAIDDAKEATFYRPTGRLRHTSLPLECHRKPTTRKHSGSSARHSTRPEEQSRTGGCQSSGVEGQPQCPGLWHSSNPNARSLSHSPSAPTPSFTQSPCPPRSLVRDGWTHPHRPRLVVSHSTCPPLSSPPTRTAL